MIIGHQLPSSKVVATRLVNEASAISEPFIVVIDDYHLITNQEINKLVNILIQYLPANKHLTICARQDPPIDIVTLRAKNLITEIRLTELRFDEAEARQYLDNKLGTIISPELARVLYQRSEGWAVGLRLAVLVLRNQVDHERFLQVLQGSNQYVMGYLVQEVLSKQPGHVQTFLMKTSLLDRFCASLCKALLKSDVSEARVNTQELLDYLQQNNLFLIPIDPGGEWFRYHQLFQDLLRHQLHSAVSEQEIRDLHLQASAWFSSHGFIDEALDHAFLAGDMQRAAQIVTQVRFSLMNKTQWQRLEQLLHRFPAEIISQQPDLLTAEIWLYYQHNQWTRIPAAFNQLQQLIDDKSGDGQDLRYLQGEMSALYSLLLYRSLDIDGVIQHAEQALTLTAPEIEIVRVLARMMLAGTRQLAGDFSGAYAIIYSGFDEEVNQSNTIKAAILVTACFVSWVAADLKTLEQNASQVVKLAQKPRSPGMLGFGHYFLGMVAYHQNDLPAAKEHFSFVNQRPYATYNDSFVYSACGLALTCQALDQEQEARKTVEETLAYLLQTGNNELLPVMQAFHAELALRQGRLSTARQWARQLDPPPTLSPMTQFYAPHMTLIRTSLAEDNSDGRKKAAKLLDQLQKFLQLTHIPIFLIEALALQAICHQMQGDEDAALKTLEQALALALPGKFIRLFADLGPTMGHLLAKLTLKDPEMATFRGQVLTAMAADNQTGSSKKEGEGTRTLIEPLTGRELDVLLLIDQGKTDREIAAELMISTHTVRTHTKNIYAKLMVNNRRQAAKLAKELGLIIPH